MVFDYSMICSQTDTDGGSTFSHELPYAFSGELVQFGMRRAARGDRDSSIGRVGWGCYQNSNSDLGAMPLHRNDDFENPRRAEHKFKMCTCRVGLG